MKISEQWLREWVNPEVASSDLAEQLTLIGLETHTLWLEGENVLEVAVTPNRGDCLSVLGIAREVAALYKLPLHEKPVPSLPLAHAAQLPVLVEEKEACPCYVGRLIQGCRPESKTPTWMEKRLAISGIQSIHPVVDILNYVMLELGQPMHAFDAQQLHPPLVVRRSYQGESVTLLDGKTMSLPADVVVIADQMQIQALAGIIGAKTSAVLPETQTIFLESALFVPQAIQGALRGFALQTESRMRFERGVAPFQQQIALERATQLIQEITGGEPGPLVEVTHFLPETPPIRVCSKRVTKQLGMPVTWETIEAIVTRLGCQVFSESRDAGWVTPPPFRYDLQEEKDLTEEVARLHGYQSIPSHLPRLFPQFAPFKPLSVARCKRLLVDLGLQEIITYGFVDDLFQKSCFPNREACVLRNPMSASQNVMRVSLLPGLLQTLRYNKHRQQEMLHCFEVGMCFEKQHDHIKQEQRIGGLLYGDRTPLHWDTKARSVDFYDAKRPIEALGQWAGKGFTFQSAQVPACHEEESAEIVWKKEIVGSVGRLHPDLQKQLELPKPVYWFELSWQALEETPFLVFQRPSRFPEIKRDLAFLVDKAVESDQLLAIVRKEGGPLLQEAQVFDVYIGSQIPPGKKSVAVGMVLQHPARTLVDQEVEEVVVRMVQSMTRVLGAQLRDA